MNPASRPFDVLIAASRARTAWIPWCVAVACACAALPAWCAEPAGTNAVLAAPAANQSTNSPAADHNRGDTNAPAVHTASTNALSAETGERSDSRDSRESRDRRRRGDRGDRGGRGSGSSERAGSTSDGTNGPTGKIDFATFKLIGERNIFSPSRTSRSPASEPRRQPKIDSFSLVGTMSYEKGDFAFFDGSGSDYKKALKADDSIAGYKVVEVAADEVTLEREGKTLKMRMGSQMRREDDGAWELKNNARSESAVAASSADGTTSSGDSSGDSGGADDVLQRLLKKREQELKNEK